MDRCIYKLCVQVCLITERRTCANVFISTFCVLRRGINRVGTRLTIRSILFITTVYIPVEPSLLHDLVLIVLIYWHSHILCMRKQAHFSGSPLELTLRLVLSHLFSTSSQRLGPKLYRHQSQVLPATQLPSKLRFVFSGCSTIGRPGVPVRS